MKTCYVFPAYRAIADLVQPGELTRDWTITRINVPSAHRGLQVGTQLLQLILDDADAEGVALQLEPSPSDGLQYDNLVKWYKKHDFRFTSTGYMRRRPKSSNQDVCPRCGTNAPGSSCPV